MKIIAPLALVAMIWPVAASSQIRNYNAPGNLEATIQLSCISIDKAKTSYNPVDLYLAARKCIGQNKLDDAVELFFLANVFGRYDMQRVADRTAHQAILVARMQVFGNLPKESTANFETKAKAYVEDAAQISASCAILRKMGPPTYYPRYMIQHGMSAFIGGKGDGLVPDFVPDKAWATVLDSYMHCPAS